MVAGARTSGVISVVIPVRDGAALLDAQLARVLSQTTRLPMEVVVADNGSREPAVRRVVESWRATDSRVRLVDAAARPGPAAARNLGAEAASGDLLLFCDADDLVQPGWVDELAGALGAADAAAGFLDFTTLASGPHLPPRDPTPHQFRYLPAGLGANLGVRAEVFRAVGGFDEALRTGEDIDLCWRVQTGGGRFTTAPGAVVQKRDRESPVARARQAIAYGKGDPALFRRHRTHGMPRAVRLAVKTWGWLLCNLPLLWIPRRRRTWAHAFGLRLGRLIGSVQQRVLYL
jgi:glycosyltransferase involved in cell wall biosynthesis